MSADEVAIAVARADRFLVLLRAPDRGGYWNLAAGHVEPGETDAEAATRELREETGLEADVVDLGLDSRYDLPDGSRITLGLFAATAPAGWEPTLDAEHVEYRWLDRDGAVGRLRYPQPRAAVRAAATLLRRTQ